MTTTQEEFFAATIRKQIADLEGLLQKMESDPIQDGEILSKVRDIENQLRKLQSKL